MLKFLMCLMILMDKIEISRSIRSPQTLSIPSALLLSLSADMCLITLRLATSTCTIRQTLICITTVLKLDNTDIIMCRYHYYTESIQNVQYRCKILYIINIIYIIYNL